MNHQVVLPNGNVLRFADEKHANNARIIAAALAAMPAKPGKPSNIALFGQQSALAKMLGHLYGANTVHPGKPNHSRVYNLLMNGQLPRDATTRQTLLTLASK